MISLGIVYGLLLPHAPILLKEVGGSATRNVALTRAKVAEFSQRLSSLDVQAMVLIGPHGPLFSDSFTIHPGPYWGSFAAFGQETVQLKAEYGEDLAELIMGEVGDEGLPIAYFDAALAERFGLSMDLDHGSLVPLYLLKEQGFTVPTVIISTSGLGLVEHYKLGMAVARAAQSLNLRTVFVASGDFSHCLGPDSPSPFNNAGVQYDTSMIQWLRAGDVSSIVNIESQLLSDAAQCGHRPICTMLGALDNKNWLAHGVSYEAPFGVGYVTGGFEVTHGQPKSTGLAQILRVRAEIASARRKTEPLFVALARSAVEQFVREGTLLTPPIQDELHQSKAVFVSIKKHGELRGCIGAVEPEFASLGQEIVQRAVAACSADPRFDPVEESELDDLEYSVDVLSVPQVVSDHKELDPEKYGVIVESKGRRGLLLPDLPGVSTVEQQLTIACQKAGIRLSPEVTVARFSVDRYAL